MSSHRILLIVFGYIRHIHKQYQFIIPNDIANIICILYPQFIEFEGNTVGLTDKEKEIITTWFNEVLDLENKSCILSSKLLYDYNKDGKDGKDFYKHCLNGKNTFSIVRTGFNGHIFGCFLSKPLQKIDSNSNRPNWTITIQDDKAFLCVIRSSFKNKSPELFKLNKKRDVLMNDDAYHCYNWIGPCFGYSFDLSLRCSFGNYCNHEPDYTWFQGDIKGNILCGGNKFDGSDAKQNFPVEDMTTFEINISIV